MEKHNIKILERALASYSSKEQITYIMNEYWGKKVKPRKERQSRMVRELIQYIIQPKTIIDVGCGSGHSVDGVEGFNCFLGLDNSRYFIEYAQKFYKNDKRYKFIQWDLIKDNPLSKKKFDVCICNFVAEHSTDPIGCYDLLIGKVKAKKYVLSFLTNVNGDKRFSYSHGTLIGESEMKRWLQKFNYWVWPVGDLSKENIGVPAISWFSVISKK
jgi:2-polyprenyl-3-methyl-5-hydroxy-6-metoxy-1,4-benzoquinol methylase